MKKKVFMLIIAVLVLCLTCGMLLVACDDDKDDNGGDDGGVNLIATSEILPVLTEKIDSVNTSGGELAFAMEVKQDGGVKFGLGYEKIGSDAFFYGAAGNGSYVKINATSLGDLLDKVFTIVGGKVAGATYEDGYLEISGFTLDPDTISGILGLGATVLPFADNGSVTSDGAYTITLNVERLLKDLPRILKSLGGIISGSGSTGGESTATTLSAVIEGMAGMEPGTIDGYVKTIAGLIGIEAETLDDLVDTLAEGAKGMTIDFNFMFDDRVASDDINPFLGVAGITDADRAENAINVLNFDLGATFTGYDKATAVDGDKGIKVPEGATGRVFEATLQANIDLFAAMELIDLLAEAELVDGEVVPVLVEPVKPDREGFKNDEDYDKALEQYNKDLEAYNKAKPGYDAHRKNVDEYFDKNFPAAMVRMLDKIGYLSLTVDEVKGESTENILTLYLNGADGYAVAAANIYGEKNGAISGADGMIELGGVYSFEALVDYIIVMMEKGWSGAPEEFASTTGEANTCPLFGHVDKKDASGNQNADGKCDICGAEMPGIMGYVSALIPCVTSNVQTYDGELKILLDIEGAMKSVLALVPKENIQGIDAMDKFLLELLGISSNIATEGVGLLNGIKSAEIEINIPARVYGAIETPEAGSFDVKVTDGVTLVKEITAADGAGVKYVGVDRHFGNGFELSGNFTVTGIDGKAIEGAKKVQLVWVDAEKTDAGTEVVAYVTVANETVNNMITASAGGDAQYYENKVAYPLSGLHKITLKVVQG